MQKNTGFTLLEFLIVIVLSSIFLFSVAFTYREFTSKNQLAVLVNQFTDALEFARNSAITLQSNIIFCAKGENQACGSNWQRGLLIINQRNQKVLRELPAMPNAYQLYWRSTLGDSADLRWRSNGFTRGQQGSFLMCGRKDHHALSAKIIILRTGRLRVEIRKISACKMTK